MQACPTAAKPHLLCSGDNLEVVGFLPPGNHRKGPNCCELVALASYPVLSLAEVRGRQDCSRCFEAGAAAAVQPLC